MQKGAGTENKRAGKRIKGSGGREKREAVGDTKGSWKREQRELGNRYRGVAEDKEGKQWEIQNGDGRESKESWETDRGYLGEKRKREYRGLWGLWGDLGF